MAPWGYEFYLRVLKVSLTRSLSSLVRDTFRLKDKTRIPARPCNILCFLERGSCFRVL